MVVPDFDLRRTCATDPAQRVSSRTLFRLSTPMGALLLLRGDQARDRCMRRLYAESDKCERSVMFHAYQALNETAEWAGLMPAIDEPDDSMLALRNAVMHPAAMPGPGA